MAEGQQTATKPEDGQTNVANAAATDTNTAGAQNNEKAKADGLNLDSLLDEYLKPKADASNTNQDSKSKIDGEFVLTKEDVEYLRGRKARDTEEVVTSDIQHAVKLAKGEGEWPEGIDELMEGNLHHLVANDPKMRAAWTQRGNDPAAWDKIATAAGEKFGKMLDKFVEARLAKSNSSVESAVFSAKTHGPTGSAPTLGALTQMSEADFAAAKDAAHGG